MVEELISFNHIEHCFVPLLTLGGKGIKQSQFPRETDDSESNFHLPRINLAHTLGALTSHSQATVGFTFRLMDRATLPDYRESLFSAPMGCFAT